jgi:hypothetical protein
VIPALRKLWEVYLKFQASLGDIVRVLFPKDQGGGRGKGEDTGGVKSIKSMIIYMCACVCKCTHMYSRMKPAKHFFGRGEAGRGKGIY